jgi:DNA polymerase I
MIREVILTTDELDKWVGRLQHETIALDTEGSSLLFHEMQLYGISLFDGKQACYIDLYNNEQREELLKKLQLLFQTKITSIVGHNLVFDLTVLKLNGFNLDKHKLFDTMVAIHLINEESEKSLKKLSKEYLGVNPTYYKEASETGPNSKQFREYAIDDAVYTGQLYVIFKKKLPELELEKLFNLEMQFIPCVVEMQYNGFRFDTELAKIQENQLKIILTQLQVEMSKMLGKKYTVVPNLFNEITIETEINFNSAIQVGKVIYGELGLPQKYLTESGKPSVGADALEAMKKAHPFIPKLLHFKKIQKLLSSFYNSLPKLVGKDGRIRSHFNICGTKTGRLSSSDPNMQQLPKESKEFGVNVRDCFIASEGYTVLTCDYSGQELRVLTQLTKDPTLIDSFNAGKDLHLATAKSVFHLDIPDEALLETNKELLDEYKTKYKKDRDKAKIVNFGIAYGKGPQGFAADFNISVEEATKIIDAYFAGMPTVKKSIEATKQEVQKQGYVKTMAGRYRHFTQTTRDGNSFYTNSCFRQAFNFKIQGYSADMIRIATVKCKRLQQQHPEWDLRFLATVHDEVVFEVRNEYVEQASAEIKECFESAVTFIIPILAEIGVGNSYGKAK